MWDSLWADVGPYLAEEADPEEKREGALGLVLQPRGWLDGYVCGGIQTPGLHLSVTTRPSEQTVPPLRRWARF